MYKDFLDHTNSAITTAHNLHAHFETYSFSSEIGKGYTAVYTIESYASICIVEHLYYRDFKYTVQTDAGVYFHQYDSIVSDWAYTAGRVCAGMQYIQHAKKAETVQYVIKKQTPAKIIGICLRPEYCEEYLNKTAGMPRQAFYSSIDCLPKETHIPTISHILYQIRKFSGTKGSAKLFFKSKVDEIAALLLQRAEQVKAAEHAVAAFDHAAVVQILEYIGKNLDKKLPLEELAKRSCMSPSKFKYVFKAVTGFSLTDYLFTKRMECACDMLLNTNQYVANIAQSLGYHNIGYFSARFKAYTGMLPNEYRIR